MVKNQTFLVVAALSCGLALSGCSAKYQTQNLSGAATIRLDHQKSVFVTVPEDGAYETKRYAGSGQTVAQETAAAFSSRAIRVHIGEQRQATEAAVSAARKVDAGYLVIPTIAHWEHRATEWSGRPSVMSLRLTILDVQTGEQITAASIEGRSRIVSWTSTSPQSLLREPLRRYVASIY